jgi:DNA-binding NarL/FixJ family response regulator
MSAVYSGMPRSTPALRLSAQQGKQIEQWLAAMGTPQQVAVRCRIIVALAEGEREASIASRLAIHRKTVRLWRARFYGGGSQ